MNFIIVTNSYKRELNLVERSLRSSLTQDPSPSEVIFIDQNTPELQLSRDILDHPLFSKVTFISSVVSKARNSLKIPADTDWIIFLPFLDLISLPIAFRIAHGVPAKTIGFNFEKVWTISSPNLLKRIFRCLAYCNYIHPINAVIWYPIAFSLLSDIGYG